MAERYAVGMLLLHGGTPKDREQHGELAKTLGGDVEVTEPDDLGVFEVRLDAEDLEGALNRVWDAVAASGSDDHIVFLEHPDLPEHWRRRSARPGAGAG